MLLFCMTYALEYPWRPFGWIDAETAVARAFVQPELLRPHIMGLLARGCAAAGLPPALLPVLLPAMLARMALRHAGGPTSSTTNSTWTAALAAWGRARRLPGWRPGRPPPGRRRRLLPEGELGGRLRADQPFDAPVGPRGRGELEGKLARPRFAALHADPVEQDRGWSGRPH